MAALPDRARRRLGPRGWLGSAATCLGTLAAFAVPCLHFPEQLTTPELRAVYPMRVVRAVIAGGIVLAAYLVWVATQPM